ncbi:MAG: HPF/RaiA family ribosome-associated protein, partial [Acidimicrobiales bacterium]
MNVVIANGRKIVPDWVRTLVEEKVGRLLGHCPGLERAEVHFSEEHNPRIANCERCEVILSGHGRVIR